MEREEGGQRGEPGERGEGGEGGEGAHCSETSTPLIATISSHSLTPAAEAGSRRSCISTAHCRAIRKTQEEATRHLYGADALRPVVLVHHARHLAATEPASGPGF